MQDFEEMLYMNGEKLGDELEYRWLREFRTGAEAKGMDLDCGKNVRQYMLDAGFVDVDAKPFQVPYYRDRKTPKEISDLLIGDSGGYFWHTIPRMVKGLGVEDEEVSEMKNDIKRCVAKEEGKYH